MKTPLNRGGLRFYLVLFALAACRTNDWFILAGAPLILLGVALHTWAKGCLRQNLEVTMIGPYRFVRHPFYLANLLIDVGIAVMSGWLLLVALLPAWWFLIYIPVMRSEDAYVGSCFPTIHPDYRKRVSALIPLHRPLPKVGPQFSWNNRNIAAGNELQRAIRILAYPLLFHVWHRLLVEWQHLPHHRHSTDLFSASMLIALYVVVWELNRNIVKRRPILPQWLSRIEVRAVFGALFLAAATVVLWSETEFDSIVLPIGGALVAISLLVWFRSRRLALAAEGLALVGIAFLTELLWLIPLVVVFYTALFLDRRLPRAEAPTEEFPLVAVVPRAWSVLYFVLIAGGAAGATLKELFIG